MQDAIYPILKLYRAKIELLFSPDTPVFQTLPALTDDGSGTPGAGSLTGSLNPAGTEATLTGTASASVTVTKHQFRASVGPEPSADDEALRAEFELGQAITLTSNYGLGVPGAKVHWRQVAVTADGHEKSTPRLTFQRPL